MCPPHPGHRNPTLHARRSQAGMEAPNRISRFIRCSPDLQVTGSIRRFGVVAVRVKKTLQPRGDIRRHDLEDLVPTSCSRNERNLTDGHAERLSERHSHGLGGPTVDGRGIDRDHQGRAIPSGVPATNPGPPSTRLDPNRDPLRRIHPASVHAYASPCRRAARLPSRSPRGLGRTCRSPSFCRIPVDMYELKSGLPEAGLSWVIRWRAPTSSFRRPE